MTTINFKRRQSIETCYSWAAVEGPALSVRSGPLPVRWNRSVGSNLYIAKLHRVERLKQRPPFLTLAAQKRCLVDQISLLGSASRIFRQEHLIWAHPKLSAPIYRWWVRCLSLVSFMTKNKPRVAGLMQSTRLSLTLCDNLARIGTE